MPRRKPQSSKLKRQKLLDKRALKRGDLSVEEHNKGLNELNDKYGRNRQLHSNSGGVDTNASSVRLKSKFFQLSPEYLSRTKNLSFEYILERPLSPQSSIFPLEILTERDIEGRLTCPSRPKFKVGQSKKEVEKNEEGVFKKWLTQTQDIMQSWIDAEEDEQPEDDNGHEDERKIQFPRGPTWFETNLEVWRQLWRVTESSSILLLLLDSRCPLLHCPPSLRSYLKNLKPQKEIILGLTKSDLVDPVALEGWRDWVRGWWGEEGIQIVSVRSYDVELLDGGRGRHRPDIPQDSLEQLIIALKTAHERLREPPSWAQADEQKLKEWKPTVRPTIDWSSLAHEEYPYDIATSRPTSPPAFDTDPEQKDTPSKPQQDQSVGETEASADYTAPDPTKEPLTIGLIGQPNVGKSSLLNALLGEQKVKASRTPGKTKHFQTMFWGAKKEIRFVDCPGLVCPSLVGLEIQALAATIPISQIASLPACITFCAKHLPLETIFKVPYSVADGDIDPYAGKRTFRNPQLAEEERIKRAEDEKRQKWTAGKIMEGRALDRGYLSAKSGRPDINRAANGIMRLLADGRIKWGFYPPGMKGKEGQGIWLESGSESNLLDNDEEKEHTREDGNGLSTASEQDEFDDDEDPEEISEEDDEEEEESEGKEDKVPKQAIKRVGGFFDALGIDDDGDEDEEEEEETDEDEDEDEKEEGEKK